MEAQTELFLEELRDRPVETEAMTQTEPFLDRPPSPLFIPSKTGVDKETEIATGELFDFELEVKPLLEVLVGKTLRISMLEVMEEEELFAIEQRQREFEQMRNAELMEVQRLDAEASRRFAEKQRRVAQETKRLREQAELQEKVAARAFAKNYLTDLSDAVFNQLESTGHFYDPVHREVEQQFLPWLLDAVVAQADTHQTSRAAADDLLQAALDLAAHLQRENQRCIAELERDRLAKLEAIAEALRQDAAAAEQAANDAARLEAEQAEQADPGTAED